MATAILDWPNTTNLATFTWCGHVMGVKVAIQMASMTSLKKITKLIIADSAPVNYLPNHTKIVQDQKPLTTQKFKRTKMDSPCP